MKDNYKNFSELLKREKGSYSIDILERKSNTLILGIHGGGIELGVSELVKDIAGKKHSYYLFEGNKKKENSNLHITSKNFDEPHLLGVISKYERIISIHGCRDKKEVLYIGGKDKELIKKFSVGLVKKGFNVKRKKLGKFSAKSRENICNKGKLSKGVQIEISRRIRSKMFEDILSRKGRNEKTKMYDEFIYEIKDLLK